MQPAKVNSTARTFKYYLYELPPTMNVGLRPSFAGINRNFKNEPREVETESRLYAILKNSSSRTRNPADAATQAKPTSASHSHHESDHPTLCP